MHARGANVALNFIDPFGAMWDCWHVEQLANAQNISLRAGCHCNPGAREAALGFTRADLGHSFQDKDRMAYDEYLEFIRSDVTGVVRASLGIASTFDDVYRFVAFARELVDTQCTSVVAQARHG